MARELEVALEAATAAGQVLSENFGREQAVRFKGRWTSSPRSTSEPSG